MYVLDSECICTLYVYVTDSSYSTGKYTSKICLYGSTNETEMWPYYNLHTC